jgi:hypothetical protein
MVGGTVLVTRLEDETVDSPWGPLSSRVYYLRPGVSLVYVEADAPHRILKLTQSLGKYALEALLSRVTEGRGFETSSVREARPQEARRGQREARVRRPQRQPDASQTESPPPETVGGASGGRRSRRRNRNKTDRVDPRETAVQPPRVEPQRPVPEAADAGGANRSKRRRRVRRRGGKGNGNGGGGSGSPE